MKRKLVKRGVEAICALALGAFLLTGCGAEKASDVFSNIGIKQLDEVVSTAKLEKDGKGEDNTGIEKTTDFESIAVQIYTFDSEQSASDAMEEYRNYLISAGLTAEDAAESDSLQSFTGKKCVVSMPTSVYNGGDTYKGRYYFTVTIVYTWNR